MKLQMLKKTDEFSSVFSFRKRIYGEFLVANIKPNQQTCHRYGLVVSKKLAKLAVNRNYMKRVLRALLSHVDNVAQGYDVVIQVRKPFQHPQFDQVQQDLSFLIRRLQKASSTIHPKP